MPLLMLAALLAFGQPEGPPVRIRPGAAPERTPAVPASESAEPLGLAVAGFDRDGDARTSRAEYDAAIGRTFAAADANRDGALGYIEYAAWATAWLGSATALPGPFAIDTDNDDRLSATEFAVEFGRHFTRLDRDRDGAVSHAELITVRNPRLAPIRPPRPPLLPSERSRERR